MAVFSTDSNTHGSRLWPTPEPLPGYCLLFCLGQGGFGQVWKAEAPGGFEVALKFVHLANGARNIEVKALEVIKRIHHPHLLTPFASWLLGEWLVVGMELGDRSLFDRFREATSQGFPGIPGPELAEYMLETAKGIDYLNEPRTAADGSELQGIQHRDIKPQNLLLVGGGIKVADFGLVRLLEHSLSGHTGAGMSIPYAAPEFFNNKTSRQSDQYSLAVTYCHLLGGRLPFTGSLAEIMAGHVWGQPDLTMLSVAEQPVVARALAKAPNERWPSCRDFINALRSMKPSEVQSTSRVSEFATDLVNRGIRLLDKGDLDGAIADYDAAIRLDPKFTLAYYNRGIARADKGDLDGAMADYDAAIRLDPKHARAYYNRGIAREGKGDLDGAIDDYDAAIRLDPKHARA
jgi:serine/threonine protein kinase